MKKNLLSTLLLTVMSMFAFAQLPTFEWRLENEQLTSATTYQFDVNIYNTGSTAFELRGGTIAFMIDTAWSRRGTLTVTTPSSGLVAGQQGSAASFAHQTATAAAYFRKIITTVGATVGTTIPANSMVKCFTFVLTNTVAFSTTVPPRFTWKYTAAAPAAGFNYTDGNGNSATVVINNQGSNPITVITNQAFCYTPIYWNGTDWRTANKTTNASVIPTPAATLDAVVYTGTVADGFSCRHYNLRSGTTHTLNSGILNVSGNVLANGTLSSSSGTIRFLGNAFMRQTTNTSLVANRVTINSSLGVALGGSLTINDTLSLTNGNMFLSNNNLIMGSSAKRFNGSSTSYIVTNGTGTLNMSNIGATPVTFPVGTSTGYNPATIENLAVTDNFQVSVADTISVDTAITTNAVKKTWKITENNPGTAVLILNLQWNAADELPSFARSNSYISYINNLGKWIPAAQTAASGSSPYVQTLNGVVLNSSFNSFGVASSGTLPISLMSFTGAKKASSVDLNWKTASEINAKEFQVERMDNGGVFNQIGTVRAFGNTNKLTAYSFVDFAASKQAIRYYRLKMVDFDGKYKYSNTIKIADENSSNEVVVYPNPTTEKISITNSNLNFAAVTFKVMNLTGDVVKVGTTNINEINVSELAAGMYMLSVIDEANEAVTVKFIKK
jgi:hypothetical protein